MKTLFAKKVSFVVLLVFTSGIARAAMVVKQLKGNAFMIFATKTQSLHTGDHVPAGAEVLTEEGTELTLANYHNHQFHITGSGHLKVNKKQTLLLEGYLWFRSTSQGKGGALSFDIRTANGVVQYNDTEGIVSFDPYSGKTQFLNFRGDNAFFNKVRPGPQYEIKSGMFSFIDNNHNQGIPRRPSRIGIKPYKKLMALYDDIRPLPPVPGLWDKVQGRSIASVQEEDELKKILKQYSIKQANKRQGGPSPIKVNIYAPSSSRENMENREEETTPQPLIKISKKKPLPSSKGRSPASLSTTNQAPQSNPFEQALQSRYKDKMRHKKEINSLIDALKSINKDYR